MIDDYCTEIDFWLNRINLFKRDKLYIDISIIDLGADEDDVYKIERRKNKVISMSYFSGTDSLIIFYDNNCWIKILEITRMPNIDAVTRSTGDMRFDFVEIEVSDSALSKYCVDNKTFANIKIY